MTQTGTELVMDSEDQDEARAADTSAQTAPVPQLLTARQVSPPVVVGISRNTGSPDALRFALSEAQLRRTSVLAVTAWRPPKPPSAPGVRPPGVLAVDPGVVLLAEQDRMAAWLADLLGTDLAGSGVTFEVRRGSPAPVLLEAARSGQLLVLDSPRSGRISSLHKAWIAPAILARAPCPVVIMPPTNRRGPRLFDPT